MTDRHVLPPYSLRMPAELRESLETAAKQAKRSLNAEIIARLESTFEDREPYPLTFTIDKQKLLGKAGYTEEVATKLAHADFLIEEMREKIFRVIDDAISEALPPPATSTSPKKKPAHKIKWTDPDKK